MRPLVTNKNARFDFEVLETYEAGVELLGTEVKALRAGKGVLQGARVVVRGGEAYLVGVSIPPHQAANAPRGYDPERSRRLLLSKREIMELAQRSEKKGLTAVPLMLYAVGRNIKVRLAIVRRKKKQDKREVLRKRDAERHIERTLKNQ